MKIGNLNSTTGNPGVVVDGKPAAKAQTAQVGVPADKSATVALSTTASQLTATPTDATFDTAKVDRIASAIRDGNYQVNHEVIADKMIANAREVLARVSGRSGN